MLKSGSQRKAKYLMIRGGALPERAQQLIGYSIHPPFMGYVDGMHPGRVLANI